MGAIIGLSKNGWPIREHPIKMDDSKVPLFQETTISCSWIPGGIAWSPIFFLLSRWVVHWWYEVPDDSSWGHLHLLQEPPPKKSTIPFRFPIGKRGKHQQIKAQVVLSHGQVSIRQLGPVALEKNLPPHQTSNQRATIFILYKHSNLDLNWNAGNAVLCLTQQPVYCWVRHIQVHQVGQDKQVG